MWNVYITAITAGLLSGSEVPCPDCFAHETIRRKAETTPNALPAPRSAASRSSNSSSPMTTATRMSRTLGMNRHVCEGDVKRIYRDHGVRIESRSARS